ncbi:MAG: fasciclin domain-containing protein [Anaerolineae bacterium]|nr:fasciclin domain-containing protein [Anaerolineae bacterium]
MRKFVLLVAALAAILVLAVAPAAAQEPTIAEIVVQSASGDPAEFTILLAAVQAADPAILAALSDPGASLTVFAPTDAAFERLLNRLGISAADLLSNTALLNDVLLYHVVAGEYDAAALFDLSRSGWPNDYLQTLQGTYVEFTDDDGSLIVDYAWVQAADIQASNGIVHVIYEVLDPSFVWGEEGLGGH